MRRLLKGILISALVSVLIAAPVLAWIVAENGVAEVSLTIRRAEASWELVDMEIGPINSGSNFTATNTTVLRIENAETLYVSFAVVTLTEEERAALEGLWVSIGEDTNDDGEIDVLWGTIECDPIPIPFPDPVPLSSGDYNVVIFVAGITGYPDVETPIGFTVEGTCDTLPVPIP